MTRLFAIATVSAVAFPFATEAAEIKIPGKIPLFSTPPVVDGKIHKTEWQRALFLGALDSKTPGFPKTEAWIGRDHANFYIAIRCEEPFPKQIKTVTIPDEVKGPVYRDDSVDVFLDAGNNGRSIFHLIANSAGTVYDSQIINMREVPAAWNSGAVVRTGREEQGWTVEMAIPIDSMGHNFASGEVISINIGRSRYAGHSEERPQLASLAGGAFANAGLFVPLLVGEAVTHGNLTLLSTRRGPFFTNSAGEWAFEIFNSGPNETSIEIAFPHGGKEIAERRAVKPGRQVISVPIPTGTASERAHCRLSHAGEELFNSRYAVQEMLVPKTVAVTEEPLFEELLEVRPGGLSREAVMHWSHEARPPILARFAGRTGSEYTLDGALAEYRRDRSALIVAGLYPIFEGRETPLVVYVKPIGAFEAGVPQPPDGSTIRAFPWLLDPRSMELYLQHAREHIEAAKEKPAIWALFAGDETWEINDRNLKWLLDHRRGDYPELDAADAEIREKYGYGKYGLPESSNDTNPYRWIATRRWEVDKMLGLARKVRAMIDAECPRLKWISWDNQNGHFPYALGQWGKVFDIQTGQLYPSKNSDREDIGFNTRWLRDLSGLDEVWPCPHVEHYPGNFTPEEVEELYSQIFRNGATGLHLYSSDTINNRAGSASSIVERIGAPERWNVTRSIIDRLQNPFRVKLASPESAIFYSNTSYQGQPGMIKTLEVEWAYTILGPRLRGALRFIDESACENGASALIGYKTIHIPYAPIVDDAEYSALEEYVKKGGTLVVGDPLAFRNRSDGSERTEGALLTPVATVDTKPAQGALTVVDGRKRELSPLGQIYQLSAGKALASWSDGQPAVVQRALGRGKVVSFASNPFALSKTITDRGWIGLFREIQTGAGAVTEDPAWRFRFPATPPYQSTRPSGVCVTENYLEWRASSVEMPANLASGGSYRISRPDLANAEPAQESIPFSKGRLTDRKRGAEAKNEASVDAFCLTWKSDAPLEVTFDLNRNLPAQRARLFFSGRLPAGRCEVSEDGTKWTTIAEWAQKSSIDKVAPWKSEEEAFRHSVVMHQVEWKPSPANFVKIVFDKGDGSAFTLFEADIWAANED